MSVCETKSFHRAMLVETWLPLVDTFHARLFRISLVVHFRLVSASNWIREEVELELR
jgi:hypothetical protein